MSTPSAPGWQSIESAPKDGKRMIGWDGEQMGVLVWWEYAFFPKDSGWRWLEKDYPEFFGPPLAWYPWAEAPTNFPKVKA